MPSDFISFLKNLTLFLYRILTFAPKMIITTLNLFGMTEHGPWCFLKSQLHYKNLISRFFFLIVCLIYNKNADLYILDLCPFFFLIEGKFYSVMKDTQTQINK